MSLGTSVENPADRLRLLEQVLGGVKEFVYAVDMELKVVFASKSLLEVNGWSESDLIGKHLDNTPLLPVILDQIKPPIQRVLATGVPESGLSWADGVCESGRVFCETSFAPVLDKEGRVELVCCSGRDVTNRVRAEEAAKASEQLMWSMSEAMPDILWVTDLEGRVTYMNSFGLAFYGIGREELYDYDWASTTFPEDAEKAFSTFARALNEKKPFRTEPRVRRADGQWRWMSNSGTPLVGEDGVCTGFVGAIRDVTEVVESRHALAESDQRKDVFLALLSHELRNPLTPIMGAMRLLAKGPLAESQLSCVQVLERHVAVLSRIVDDLLDLGRMTKDRMTLQLAPVDLRLVVVQAMEATAEIVRAQGHRVSVQSMDDPVWIEGDEVRLGQVVTNLINNAAKHQASQGFVGVALFQSDGKARLEISDEGAVIGEQDAPRLFELFYQAEPGPSPNSGLGVGLYLAKRLVEMHGGDIHVRRRQNDEGNVFTVELPTIEPKAMMNPMAASPSSITRPLRVLLADDNEDSARVLALLLESEGHEAHTVSDGAQAVEAFERLAPDVVLLDIGMPIVDGYSACKQIRAAAGGDGVRLVALTGWGQASDRQRAKEAGFDEHLVKPPSLETLLAALRD